MGTNNSQIDQKSLVNLFPQIQDDNGISILDIWNSYRVRVIPTLYSEYAYTTYVPKSHDTLYGLAKQFYGNVELWWLIPLTNDVEDPFDFLKDVIDAGETIKVLKQEYIGNILFTLSRLRNSEGNV